MAQLGPTLANLGKIPVKRPAIPSSLTMSRREPVVIRTTGTKKLRDQLARIKNHTEADKGRGYLPVNDLLASLLAADN